MLFALRKRFLNLSQEQSLSQKAEGTIDQMDE